MSSLETQSILHPISSLMQSSREEGITAIAEDVQASPTVGTDFVTKLHEAIQGVDDLQQTATTLQTNFELGDKQVSLPQVMVAMSKSSLAFEATNQVRNRLLSAYQEVMSMSV